MDAPQADRAILRKRLLAEREAFVATPARAVAEQAIGAALHDAIARLEPADLGLYWPFGPEFNVATAFADDLAAGKFGAALPYARRTPRALEFRRWDGGPPVVVDECGIATSDGAVVVPDVIVVPCVGFTADGYRLGYGGGYYDRWLALHPHVVAVGVGWSIGEIDGSAFAAQAHDRKLAFVVTEHGVR